MKHNLITNHQSLLVDSLFWRVSTCHGHFSVVSALRPPPGEGTLSPQPAHVLMPAVKNTLCHGRADEGYSLRVPGPSMPEMPSRFTTKFQLMYKMYFLLQLPVHIIMANVQQTRHGAGVIQFVKGKR